MIDSSDTPGTELTTAAPPAPPPAPLGDPARVKGRRRAFVDHYLVTLNGAKSAELAGYAKGKSAKVQAARLLTDVDILTAIRAGMAERAKRTEVTQDRVVKELARIAFADMRGLVRWGSYTRGSEAEKPASSEPPTEEAEAGEEEGSATIAGESLDIIHLLPSDELDPDDAAAVAEVGAGPNGLRIKLHDKQKALELLGRHLGMWNDPAQGPNGSVPIPPAINIVLVDARGERP